MSSSFKTCLFVFGGGLSFGNSSLPQFCIYHKTFNFFTCSYWAKSTVIFPPNICDIIPLSTSFEAAIGYSVVNLSFILLLNTFQS